VITDNVLPKKTAMRHHQRSQLVTPTTKTSTDIVRPHQIQITITAREKWEGKIEVKSSIPDEER